MEPENDGSRKESPLPEILFSGSILVNFGSVDFFWIFFTGQIFFGSFSHFSPIFALRRHSMEYCKSTMPSVMDEPMTFAMVVNGWH